MKRRKIWVLAAAASAMLALSACGGSAAEAPAQESAAEAEETVPEEAQEEPSDTAGESEPDEQTQEQQEPDQQLSDTGFSISDIEEYTDQAYVEINDNKPYFSEEDLTEQSFEYYSDLDELGRCGTAYACIGIDLMPTEERGSISQVKPTGWKSVEYDVVDGKHLYNRCHLIGFQLSGENANEKNLITGTRYLNVDGMLPFENMIADYVEETENHVLYRVTPVFEGDNLVASGVLLEAQSVEDQGEDIQFCTYVYNVQPGVEIDYETGESRLAEAELQSQEPAEEPESEPSLPEPTEEPESEPPLPEPTDDRKSEPASQEQAEEPEPEPEVAAEAEPRGTDYILNTSTKKFHYPSCGSVGQMKESNKEFYTGSRDDVIARGYDPCKKCNP